MAFLSRGSLVPLSNLLPQPVGITGSAGSSLLAARADHIHAAGALTGSSGVVWTAGTLWSDIYAEASAQVPNRIIVPNDNTDRHITAGSYDLSQIEFVAEARVTTSGSRAPIIVDNNAILTGGLHLRGVHFRFTCTTGPSITASVFLDLVLRDAQISNNAGATKEPILCPAGVTSQQIRLYEGSKIGDSGAIGVGIVKLANGASATVVGLSWAWFDDLSFVTPGSAALSYEYDASTATSGTPFGAGITVTEAQLDGADLVGYTPTTTSDWASVPSRVSEALDDLAAQVGSGSIGSGTFVHIAGTESITGAKTFTTGLTVQGAVLTAQAGVETDTLTGFNLASFMRLRFGTAQSLRFSQWNGSVETETARLTSTYGLQIGNTTTWSYPGVLIPNQNIRAGSAIYSIDLLGFPSIMLGANNNDVSLSSFGSSGVLYLNNAIAANSTINSGNNTFHDILTLASPTIFVTPTIGYGSALAFKPANAAGTGVISGRITSVWSNAGAGTEVGAMAFQTLTGGTLTERMRIAGSGGVTIGTSGTDPGANNLRVDGGATIVATLALGGSMTLPNTGTIYSYTTSAALTGLLTLYSDNRIYLGSGTVPVTIRSTDTHITGSAARSDVDFMWNTATAATVGTPRVASPILTLRGTYWTGSASANIDATLSFSQIVGSNTAPIIGESALTFTQGGNRTVQFMNSAGGVNSAVVVGRGTLNAVALGSAEGFGNFFEYYNTFAMGRSDAASHVGLGGSTNDVFTLDLKIWSTGNVRIGSTNTDPGVKLQVDGSTYFNGSSQVVGTEDIWGNTTVRTSTAATVGSQFIAAPTLTQRGSYWNGSAATAWDAVWALTPSAASAGDLDLTMGGATSWRVARFKRISNAAAWVIGDSNDKAMAFFCWSGWVGFRIRLRRSLLDQPQYERKHRTWYRYRRLRCLPNEWYRDRGPRC
jgi:hypothetical protein